MIPPPSHLDGARVLHYAISRRGGFHDIKGGTGATVVAMAICNYDGAGEFYLFKCAADWDVVQDWDCASVDEAMQMAALQVKGEIVEWMTVASA